MFFFFLINNRNQRQQTCVCGILDVLVPSIGTSPPMKLTEPSWFIWNTTRSGFVAGNRAPSEDFSPFRLRGSQEGGGTLGAPV